MPDATAKFPQSDLTEFVRQVFEHFGVEAEHARTWAEVLIWANLRGVDSHGVLRVPSYAERLRAGEINARPNIRVDPLAGAIARIDADLAPGPVAMDHAMREAIGKAKAYNVGWCTVANMTHAGAIGYFALQAAKAGFAGLAMTASQPMMGYPGASGNVVSTNPIAIAVPGGDHPPLLLDMSTATVGMGKIMQARDAGVSIPLDWGVDGDGGATSDPNQVSTLSPLGGAKGAGLSLMIECLTSIAVGNPLIAPVLHSGKTLPGRPVNGIAIAVNVTMFDEGDAFAQSVDALAGEIRNLPKAGETEHIYAPGERGDAILTDRAAAGIPLAGGTVTRLRAVAEECRIAFPNPKP